MASSFGRVADNPAQRVRALWRSPNFCFGKPLLFAKRNERWHEPRISSQLNKKRMWCMIELAAIVFCLFGENYEQ